MEFRKKKKTEKAVMITKVISKRGFKFSKYKSHMDSKHFMHFISFLCM